MEAHYKINVSITGLRPLLQNAFTSDTNSSPGKKGQTYDDQEEAEKRLIKDSEGTICQPSTHIEGALVKSGVEFKFQGKKTYKDIIKAGILVEPYLIPHSNTQWVIDKQRVVVNRAGILRCRPRFDSWALDFTILVHEERIQSQILKNILSNAGRFHGIGDFRPKFGLFEVSSFEVQENI